MKIDDDTKEITAFTESTKKQARIWDWAGRILPMFALAIVLVLHFAKQHSLKDTALDAILIVFLTICFIWWYWAIKKIVLSTNYLKETYIKFKEISNELRNIKKDIKQDDSNR
jgi:hypothetical protein